MADLRVVVVGAGIVGAAVAWRLAQGGVEVVVVDAGSDGRATYAGAGIVAGTWRQPDTPLTRLRNAAVAAYPGIIEQLTDCRAGRDGESGAPYAVIGELYVAPEGALLDEAETGARSYRAGGVVTRLDRSGAHDAFPYLRDDLAAVHVTGTARVDGEALRQWMLGAAEEAGAATCGGAARIDAGRGRVTGVTCTTAGTTRSLDADAVVLAAGAWSAPLARDVGAEVPVTPQRGQILHLGLDGDDTSRLPVVQPLDADHYLLPFPDHRIVAGATRETGAGFDPQLTAGGVARVLADALRVAPGLAPAAIVQQRVGLRPASADGLPLLGEAAGVDGLWVATGMGAQGLTLGPYCASLVADAILGRPLDSDLEPFRPQRPMPASG